jgi:hypothetical protein
MAAPRYAPVPVGERARTYRSPDHIPASWSPDRPAEIEGRQPEGPRLGYQGPDQGFALTIAARYRDRIHTAAGETVDDAVRGSVAIALRRASLFGRAPVVHDVVIALTIWGWLDASPPADLVERRRTLFEGVGNVVHHYVEGRRIADLVPESTLRMTPDSVRTAYPSQWRVLTGA